MAAGQEERLLADSGTCSRRSAPRTLPGGGGSGQVFHVASHLPESQVRLAEARAVARDLGMRLDQRLTHRQGRARRRRAPRQASPTDGAASAVLVWQFARESLSSGVAELASASFCRIASSRV